MIVRAAIVGDGSRFYLVGRWQLAPVQRTEHMFGNRTLVRSRRSYKVREQSIVPLSANNLSFVVESGDDLSFGTGPCGAWWLASSDAVALSRVESSVDAVEVFGHGEAECVVQALLLHGTGRTYLFGFVPVL